MPQFHDLQSTITAISPMVDVSIRNALIQANRIFHENASGSGLLHLTTLLSGTGGVLRAITKRELPTRLKGLIPPHSYNDDQFCDEINGLKRFSSVSRSIINDLHELRVTRNQIAHDNPCLSQGKFEKAMYIFIGFMELYYTVFRNPALRSFYDASYYRKPIPNGQLIHARYEVLECLGGDEESRVYMVRDNRRGGDIFALKVVSTMRKEHKEILENEISNRPRAGVYPYIAGRLFNEDLGESWYLLALEYYEGSVFADWCVRNNNEPNFPYRLMCLARQILQALCYLHEKGIIHGCINEYTVLVTPNDDVKLVNFGYSGKAGSGRNKSAYSPKKQPLPDRTHRHFIQDIFGLGIMLAKGLWQTHQVPAHFELTPIQSSYKNYITEELVAFIKKACSSDVNSGFGSADSMLEAWETAFSSLKFEVPAQLPSGSKKIGLVTCTRRKKKGSWKARDLYSESPEFVEHLRYAEKHYHDTFIISARYGLVGLDQTLPYYDRDLRQLDDKEQQAWATFVVACLKQYLKENHLREEQVKVFIHADELYRRFVTKVLTAAKIDFEEICYPQIPSTKLLE